MTTTKKHTLTLALCALLCSFATARGDDVIVANFNGDTYDGWTTEGEAFGPGPANGTLPGQMQVAGFVGSGLVNSFYGGDKTTGKLVSPEIKLEKPFVNFLIGGGGLPGVRFELVVDGKVERIARGPNLQPGGSEALDWDSWDVSDLIGKTARFRIVDEETGGWGHINVDEITLSDKKKSGFYNEREFTIDDRYLLVPIDQDVPQRWVRIEVDGKVVREFEASLARAEYVATSDDFTACIDLNPWIGKTCKFVVEKEEAETSLAPLKFTDKVFGDFPAYNEKYRPQFHFSPRIGWTNDPNGLVYHNGLYQLFFQHNPFGTKWGNMTWGHATSPDLLHWTERGDAIYPDRLGTIFSGSGAVDVENSTGFQKDPNGPPPLVFMFTQNGPNMRYGEPASQSLAYSLDEGETLIKYEGNPTLPHIVGGNRDPKIFWDAEQKLWITALYLTGEDYALFSSADLKSWKQLCKIENLGCSECPDIFKLPVDGDETKAQWVFWGGDGRYLLGQFDGSNFVKTSEVLKAKWGGNDYAAQTYSDVPGRRIQFSWMSGGEYPGMPFNQQFTVPRELTLRSTKDGVRLCIYPVEEVKSLRREELDLVKKHENGAVIYEAKNAKTAGDLNLLDVEATIDAKGANIITVELNGLTVELDVSRNELRCADAVAPLSVVDSKIKLRLVLDRTSLEIFANDGLSQIAKCFVPQDDANPSLLKVSEDKIESVQIWTMNGVWNR